MKRLWFMRRREPRMPLISELTETNSREWVEAYVKWASWCLNR